MSLKKTIYHFNESKITPTMFYSKHFCDGYGRTYKILFANDGKWKLLMRQKN